MPPERIAVTTAGSPVGIAETANAIAAMITVSNVVAAGDVEDHREQDRDAGDR